MVDDWRRGGGSGAEHRHRVQGSQEAGSDLAEAPAVLGWDRLCAMGLDDVLRRYGLRILAAERGSTG